MMVAFIFFTHLLYSLTFGTLHLLNFEAVHLMVLLCIMTQPANIKFATTGCLQYKETHERTHPSVSVTYYSKEYAFKNYKDYPVKINKRLISEKRRPNACTVH